MGTRMKENNATLWGGLDTAEHAFEVEAFGFCAEVWVGLYREVNIGEDLVVVGPGG